jgi:mannosyltransferase OCH1-like enzyme
MRLSLQIIRLEALKQYGGIYLDSDVFVINGTSCLAPK